MPMASMLDEVKSQSDLTFFTEDGVHAAGGMSPHLSA
jgi:hypothetical protein